MNTILIYYLIKVRINYLLNSFKKKDTWLKITFIVFFLYYFANLFISSTAIANLLRPNIVASSEYQHAILNVILFTVFIMNVFITFFIGSSGSYMYNYSVFLRMPITINKIVITDIISGMLDIFNLLFIPIYYFIFFLFNPVFYLANLLIFTVILLFFLLFISNTIYLINITFNLLISINKYFIISFLVVILFINYSSLFLTKGFILYIGSILDLFPTGVIINFSEKLHTNSSFGYFIFILTYFFVLNISLFFINIFLSKKNLHFGKIIFNTNNKKKILNLIEIHNPIIRKNVFYFFRSPKMLINFIMIFAFYTITLFPILSASSLDKSINNLLFTLKTTFLGIHFISVLIFGGNVFGFDNLAVRNYFLIPYPLNKTLFENTFLSLFYVSLNVLIAAFVLFYLHISLIDFFIFLGLVFSSYVILSPVSMVLSIYFPKSIDLTAINGLNTSLITLIFTVLITALFIIISIVVFSVNNIFFKYLLVIVLFTISVLNIFYYKTIFKAISKIFLKQKERVILLCQKKF